MPRTFFISGQLTAEEIGIAGLFALVRLQPRPALCHFMHDGRHNVLAGGAHQVRDVLLPPCFCSFRRAFRKEYAVHHRAAPGHGVLLFFPCLGERREQRLRFCAAQRRKICRAQLLPHRLPERIRFFRFLRRAQQSGNAASAHHHRAAEQPVRHGRNTKLLYAHRARGLAHKSNLARVAAKSGDIIPHPAQRGHLVKHCVVARMPVPGGKLRQAQKAHRAQTVIDGDGNNALFAPGRAVKMLFMAAPTQKSASVNIKQHGRVFCVVGSPNV